jgi:hypothetical protein
MTPKSTLNPKRTVLDEPFLLPIQFDSRVTLPETLEGVQYYNDLFKDPDTICVEKTGCIEVFSVPHGPHFRDFYVRIYDESYQPCYWCFMVTRNNLHQVEILSQQEIPSTLKVAHLC